MHLIKSVFLKTCLGAGFYLGISTFSFAQNIDFGIRSGISFANFGGSEVPEETFKMHLNYHFGIYVGTRIGNLLTVEPGAQLSNKGTKYEFEQVVQGQTYEINATEQFMYLDFPILLRIHPIPAVNIFAGPQASILLLHQATFKIKDIDPIKEEYKEQFNSFDVGMIFGCAFHPFEKLNIQLSYDLGLSNVFANSDANASNRVIKISFGYSF